MARGILVRGQGLGEGNPTGQHLLARPLDDLLRRGSAGFFDESHHHRFGDDEALAQAEIGLHPRGIDGEPGGDRLGMREGARAQHENLRQRQRLALPGAG